MLTSLSITAILLSIGEFFILTWWLWAFFIIFPMFVSTFLFWRQAKYASESEFVLLELKMPLEVKRSPEAMEQILATMHGLSNAPAYAYAAYWEGEVSLPFSLELVSFGGDIHFYIRTQVKFRTLVPSTFFSYYPDVEVIEVPDYIERIPSTSTEVDAHNYNIWGAEMYLAREDAYPIKSYHMFESPDEEKQYDPITTFLEVLGRIRKNEVIGIQFIINPVDSWNKKWKEFVEKLKDETSGKAAAVAAGEDAKLAKFSFRTPGETEVLEAVEKNLSKPGFDTISRFIYFSPKETFAESFARKGVAGIYNQYAALDLNYFARNFGASTTTLAHFFPYVFPGWRSEYRKQRMLHNYRNRSGPPSTFMGKLITSYIFNHNFHTISNTMNVESIATLFHPPTYRTLTAPHIRRAESKRAGPPAGLAIFGEDSEIEKFL